MPTLLPYAFTALGGVAVALLGFLGVRYTSRSARLATVDTNSTEWERRYRANAETHMQWDFMMRGRLQRVEERLDIHEPIPDPPPLFPKPE